MQAVEMDVFMSDFYKTNCYGTFLSEYECKYAISRGNTRSLLQERHKERFRYRQINAEIAIVFTMPQPRVHA
jgi:hypothetical protein